MTLVMLVLAAKVSFAAPHVEQTNVYRLREVVTESGHGTVTMTGIERRHISAPAAGRRAVHISFEVGIAEQPLSIAGKRWAQSQLRELALPDDGFLDDRDRLTLSDGIAVDAYPIFPVGPVEAGATWEENVSEQRCRFKLASLESGVARIVIESDTKSRSSAVRRAGHWTVDVATGRLLSWHIHTEAGFGGRKAVVDSAGEIEKKPG